MPEVSEDEQSDQQQSAQDDSQEQEPEREVSEEGESAQQDPQGREEEQLLETSEEPVEPADQEPSEQEPVEQQDTQAPQQEPQAEQPAQSEDEQPEEGADEQGQPASQEESEERPPELKELDAIISVLDDLAALCDRTLDSVDLEDRESAQELLQQYAAGLAYIPKVLQQLHDYRRHSADFYARAQKLFTGLPAARKDGHALSSEEERVIAAAASLRETLLTSIGSLERALAHVRNHTQDLLSIIAYDDDGFAEFAQPLYERVNVSFVASVAHEEHKRVLALRRDVVELRAFEDHLEDLTADQEGEDA